MNKLGIIGAGAILSIALIEGMNAQTTLSGDHIITGNMNVGTSGTNGNLTVTGQTGNAANPGISVTGDGGVLFRGTFGTGKIPATNVGTRFMWYPKKAALRAGSVISTNWDDANIGDYSVALGLNSRASGSYSVSFSGTATGANSFASGFGVASGSNAFAFGTNAIANDNAVAIGPNASAGNNAFAFGSSSIAGGGAIALGQSALASGNYSVALGYAAWASGSYALAQGWGSVASGNSSQAIGYFVTNSTSYSMVVGKFNSSVINTNESDFTPLFTIGNGTGNSSDTTNVRNRNALVVYQGGRVKIPKRQGDILMGEFGNGGGD